MKKINLKTFQKSFNLNKSKEETDFMVVQQSSLARDFGKDSLFGSCYGKDMASCDINSEDDKVSESLMGMLRRTLSAKQKPKEKAGTPSRSSAGEDTFSSSAPLIFKDVRAERPVRSTSLPSHHCSPAPWPLRPTNSEETCIKMGWKSEPSPALNGVQKDFHDLQSETACHKQANSVKSSASQNGVLHLRLEEHEPVVIGLMHQDYIQYTVPLDEGMYPLEGSHSYRLVSSSPMKVSVVPPEGEGTLSLKMSRVNQNLVVSMNGLLIGTMGVTLQSPRVSPDDVPPLSPLPSPVQNNQIQRNFSGLTGTQAHVAESMLCHLNFDPNSAPGVARVYDSVQSSGPMVVTSLTKDLKKLAEGKLANVPDGSFLTLHITIEHSNGRGHTSIVDLFEHSVRDSENGAFCYSRSATYLVRLTKPVSRFMQVRSLQYLYRFVICQYTTIDLIQKLPLPNKMKDYLQEKHY
uniref:SOCS box domain-containing protein n=1 Tax=Aotus nancymaae TaxID=37293 RepID=A0A2K5F2L6_AOTNA